MHVLCIHPNNTETVMYAHGINQFSQHISSNKLLLIMSPLKVISSPHLFFGNVWRHVPDLDYPFVMLKV